MKSLLCMEREGFSRASKVTGEAVVRRILLPMTVHAEAHRVIAGALGDRHLREIAMAGGAVDVGADVRRVVEADVRAVREPVDALPGNLDPLLRVRGHFLDERPIGGDLAVADHAGL